MRSASFLVLSARAPPNAWGSVLLGGSAPPGRSWPFPGGGADPPSSWSRLLGGGVRACPELHPPPPLRASSVRPWEAVERVPGTQGTRATAYNSRQLLAGLASYRRFPEGRHNKRTNERSPTVQRGGDSSTVGGRVSTLVGLAQAARQPWQRPRRCGGGGVSSARTMAFSSPDVESTQPPRRQVGGAYRRLLGAGPTTVRLGH